MSMPKYFSHRLIIFIQVHLSLPKYLFSKLRKLSLVEVYRSKTTKKNVSLNQMKKEDDIYQCHTTKVCRRASLDLQRVQP